MHLPRHELWQEMLAVPQLVRFTFPQQNGLERYPTLLIKAHSLLLKYIVQGVQLKLFFFRISDGHFAYALRIADDATHGAIIWSLLADPDELAALRDLKEHGGCSVYLFNEACANCAWTSAEILIDPPILELANEARPASRNPIQHMDEVSEVLDRIQQGATNEAIAVELVTADSWKQIRTDFILNGVGKATLNLLSDNEGSHQEQLAHALLGDLSPRGAYVNTQLHEPSGWKEFTDVVLTHEFGTVLLESKSLTVLEQRLPDRNKLRKTIKKASIKGLSQLTGAARSLRTNVPVFDPNGNPIQLERTQPPHAILLVPDLDLMAEDEVWFPRIKDFMRATGGFLHIMDTIQLFRMMQAARMISEASNKTSPMMAFDYYLIERTKAVIARRTINVDMILNIQA